MPLRDLEYQARVLTRFDEYLTALIIAPTSFLVARASGPRAGGTPAPPERAPGRYYDQGRI